MAKLSDGSLTSRNEYNAFGEVATNGVSNNSIGYTGQRLDNETGLMALGNGERYYSPAYARFIQQDSFKGSLNDPASLNRYSYAHNNPNKFTDPTGNVVESPWDAASLIVGLGSLGYNLYHGNYGDAAIDALGVVADTAALLLPGVPGGAGIGIKAYRVAKVTVKVLQTVDRAVNVGQGIANTYNNIQEGNYGWAAVTAGLTAFGAGGLRSSTRELNQAIKVSEEVVQHQKALQKAQDVFNAKNNPEALQEVVQDTAKAQKADLLKSLEAKRAEIIEGAKEKYKGLGDFGGEGYGKYQGNLMDGNNQKLLPPALEGVRLPDNEIVVFASTPKQGSFILRNGVDDKPIGNIIESGKSVTIATDLNIKTEFAQMFGLERAENLRRGDTLSAAFVEDIRAAGFDVIYAPTRSNHLHSRIIADTNDFESEEARELLSLAFDRISRVKKDSK